MRMVISGPELRIEHERARLTARVDYAGQHWELFLEADAAYAGAFTVGRADGFLVLLLPKAMMEAREDAELEIICQAPVTRQLLHQIENYYIPTLTKTISYYKAVRITAEAADEPMESMNAVGTGISGGVDSSYTVAKYCAPANNAYRLTHGVFFNIGIYGGYDSEAERRLELQAQEIAKAAGIEYLCIRSNFCKDLYGKAHAPVVPAVFMGLVLAMQKMFSVYYFSSGFAAWESEFSEADAAYYDWLNVMCFSTGTTQFYSSGLEVSRLDKVRFISGYPFTYEHLSVCLQENQENGNCGRCAKCTRTMAELEALGVLDRYRAVFDVEEFRRDTGYHWGYIILKSWGKDAFCRDIIQEYKAGGHKLPARSYLAAAGKWIKRGGTTVNRKREKIEQQK